MKEKSNKDEANDVTPENSGSAGSITDAEVISETDENGDFPENKTEELQVVTEGENFPDIDHSDDPVKENDGLQSQQLTSTAVAKLDAFTSVEQIKEFAMQLNLKGSSGQVLQAIVRGKELGIPSLVAFDNIYYVNGRPSYSWQLINHLISRAGIEFKTKYDNWYLQEDGSVQKVKDENSIDRIVEIEFYKRSRLTGQIITETVRYTWLQATEAGLTEKDTWKKWGSSSLLWIRCFCNGARRVGGPAFFGVYEYSEIADEENIKYDLGDDNSPKPYPIG